MKNGLTSRMDRITNWGNYPRVEARVYTPRTIDELIAAFPVSEPLIARGLGRCYGDSSLADSIVSMVKLNRFLGFDQQSGVVTVEAGTSLEEILQVCVPRGFFLPVTPGTKFVTVGGAVASDVHGKNHHKEGSFGDHVVWIDVLLPDGEVQRCSATENPDLFRSTCGGMGLTGLILRVALRLKPVETAYIDQRLIRASNLEQIFRLFEETRATTYSVAWIDCLAGGENLGRSVLFLGEHATRAQLPPKLARDPYAAGGKLKLGVPFNFPNAALSSWSVKAFNAMIYNVLKRDGQGLVHYDPFFYPLDKIHNWNRIYGKRGFVQYQPVLPLKTSYDGMRAILSEIHTYNQGSFLAVLKLFGKQQDLLSFPMEGYTLALDFPISDGLFPFLERLDQIVLQHGGRIYLTKDARMAAQTFESSYDNLDEFRRIKESYDSENRFQSLQSKRLGI